MTKYQPLKDEEVVRIARGKVQESAASTFTQMTIDTQLSIERGVIWMIHGVEFHIPNPLDLNEVAVDAREYIQLQLTRESQTSIITPDNPDLIQPYHLQINRSAAVGTDAGPLWFVTEFPKKFIYHKPLPYANQNMYFGMIGTAGVAYTSYVRVSYTIRTVSDKYFFRVAQALLG